ncbi:MAG: hypothetical protein PUE66_07965 [Erysipelotrichaceae bacterium]|nr:hypothetical protein [Erysipelotrichaceae bacterium]
MKRPTLEYAENCTLIHTYARKLEEYCDELEKAFDKACDVLADLNSCSNLCSLIYGPCPFEKKCCEYGCMSNKENWKEWCMKNE